MDPALLTYYEAIERASADMLAAARAGNWDEVVKLEGACILLIGQLKAAVQEPSASEPSADADTLAVAQAARAAIMQRILMNDAEIRQLAEPWLQTLDDTLEGHQRTLH